MMKKRRKKPLTRFEELRLSAGLSREDLASSSGVSLSLIQRVEDRKKEILDISLRDAFSLSRALNSTVHDLVDTEARKELKELFAFLNERCFRNELSYALLDYEYIDSDTLGCFFQPFANRYNSHLPVIVIRPDLCHDDPQSRTALASTLLHEMVHKYCYENGIVDCEDNGIHTSAFEEAALNHGLEVMRNKNNGVFTYLNPDCDEIWEEIGATDGHFL